jgi:hypothetical protein
MSGLSTFPVRSQYRMDLPLPGDCISCHLSVCPSSAHAPTRLKQFETGLTNPPGIHSPQRFCRDTQQYDLPMWSWY